jgi:hypothetical protein
MMAINKFFAPKSIQFFLGFAGLLLVAGCEKQAESTGNMAAVSSAAVVPSPSVAVEPSITATLLIPLDKADIEGNDNNPCFSWSAPEMSSFEFFNVAVSTTPNFPEGRWLFHGTNEAEKSVCWNAGVGWESKGSNPPAAATKLKAGVTYYWRVATGNAGKSTFSEVRTFTVTESASTADTKAAK